MAKDLTIWIDARKRFHLSDAQIQMARELGLNPTKFGSLANHKQEPWKAPLPVFIAELYRKRFGKDYPDDVRPLEQVIAGRKTRKAERKIRREEQSAAHESSPAGSAPPSEAPF